MKKERQKRATKAKTHPPMITSAKNCIKNKETNKKPTDRTLGQMLKAKL